MRSSSPATDAMRNSSTYKPVATGRNGSPSAPDRKGLPSGDHTHRLEPALLLGLLGQAGTQMVTGSLRAYSQCANFLLVLSSASREVELCGRLEAGRCCCSRPTRKTPLRSVPERKECQ